MAGSVHEMHSTSRHDEYGKTRHAYDRQRSRDQRCLGEVFRALSDPTRLELLERLLKHDGQSIMSLCAEIGMTRYGIMRHLRILEAAGLVESRRVSRCKLHYLRRETIRATCDGWVTKFLGR